MTCSVYELHRFVDSYAAYRMLNWAVCPQDHPENKTHLTVFSPNLYLKIHTAYSEQCTEGQSVLMKAGNILPCLAINNSTEVQSAMKDK